MLQSDLVPAAVREKLQKLAKHYKEGGVSDVAQRLSSYGYVPPWLFDLVGVDIMQLEELNQRAIRRKTKGYVFRDLASQDVAAIVKLTDPDDAAALGVVFERFLAAGHSGYVVTRDDQLVAYAWAFTRAYEVTVDDYGPRTLTVTLDDDMRYFGNGLIDPAYRMKGLFPHLIKHAMDDTPSGTRFLTSVHQTNLASRRAHIRLGFEPLVSLLNLQLGGSRHLWRVSRPGANTRYIVRDRGAIPMKSLLA